MATLHGDHQVQPAAESLLNLILFCSCDLCDNMISINTPNDVKVLLVK